MGTDSIFLSLMPLIIAVVISTMIGWFIAFGVLFLGVSATLFIMGVLNDSHILSFSAILFFILGLLFAFKSARRIISESNFKKRIVSYMAEGKAIHHNLIVRDSVYTGEYAIETLSQWTNKIAEDIRKNKSSAEVDLFIDQSHALNLDDIDGNTEQAREKQVRRRVADILHNRIGHLEELLQRL